MQQWLARQKWEPIGAKRLDLLAAQICRQIIALFSEEPPSVNELAIAWDAELWREQRKAKVKSIISGRVAREGK